MHLTECFSVPRLTLSGFLPSCNFHTQLLGFAFLNFPLDEDSFYFFQCLSLDMKNQLSPCLSQWGSRGKALEGHSKVLAFWKSCTECYKSVIQAGKAVSAATWLCCPLERRGALSGVNTLQNDKRCFA